MGSLSGSIHFRRAERVQIRHPRPIVVAVSHYDVLGVSADADAEALRRAFVALARRFHPDRHVGGDETTRREAERRMREITEAWAVLGDPVRRRRYDLGLGDRARSERDRASGSEPGKAAPGAGKAGSATGAGRAGTSARSGNPSGSGRNGTASGAEGRHWRAYASPGSAAADRRPAGEQLLLLSPIALVVAAGMCGLMGAIVGWPPFYAAALVCLIGAAAAFFLLPILAMTRGSSRRGGRGPKRSY
jgi:DnaJ-domain-containing protein 1